MKEAGKDLTKVRRKESNAEGRMEEWLLPEGLPGAGGKGAGWRACELKIGGGWEVAWDWKLKNTGTRRQN